MRPSRIVAGLAVTLLSLFALPVQALTPTATESTLISKILAERGPAGLGTLVVVDDLTAAARRQALAMASAGSIFHTPDLGSVTTGWSKLGENVAMAPSVDLAHRALMGSAPHRANILDPAFTQVGVGIVQAASTLWIVEIFAAKTYTPPFADDDGSVHEGDIVRLAAAGVTTGCAPSLYCPGTAVTREQMATLLSRALDLSGTTVDLFVDDDGSWYEADINASASAGVTTGCGPDRYCPSAALSRADMAVWLVNALGLAPVATDYFSDDEGWPQEPAINALAAAGVTNGCGTTSYCPGGAVSRAQMASFLVRAFGL